ncbi:hypothetical protein SteCoe_27284 [Stentor coeruleus]|uniref:PI-PLC Y-box domain-containing protein n=1 Tax=Stentor coeruleus TaxID=5963 RepID=A0A1R2BBF6_9CILI|nr:hypothetical protein SteCoe_27284 [Stentor coeruleus]
MGRVTAFAVLIGCLAFVSATNLNQGRDNPYDLSNVVYSTNGITATATYHLGKLQAANETVIPKLFLNITYDNPQRVRIRITDAQNTRFEVPYDFTNYTIQGNVGLYNVTVSDNPMGIQVVRQSDNRVIFFLDPSLWFSYDDQDILFTSNYGYGINVLGLGERITSFIIPQGTYTLWARDRASPLDDGQSQDANMYSSQPFYMIIDEATGQAFGGLLYNANAMSATIGPQSLTFRTTGGIIDMWLFIGPTPEQVIFQYHQLIGPPVEIPYWSLGWHQSRYGYVNVSMLQQVFDNYTNYQLPLDALWNDIDYMSAYEDFMFDPVTYPLSNMTQLVDALLATGKNYIPIVDAGIAQNISDPFYVNGTSSGVWIQNPYTQNAACVGQVWPGNATFIDWLNPNAKNYWVSALNTFQQTVSFSGIWLDMNEVSNFVSGCVGHSPTLINSTTMPWTPGQDLNTNALDVAATHQNGVTEYNMHSLYGYLESKTAAQYFIQKQTRPFIISRSTFPGHGKWASKWLGDNYSQWSFMEFSIIGIFNFGMFGIPMIGADICGFLGNTNLELCSRWTQLGTMYPFSRNHNDVNSVPQEPWAFGPLLVETNNVSIRNKYMLQLYIYTHMMKISSEGGQLFKPAYWEYPSDMNLLYNATSSFMLGKALIVHPCLWYGISGSTSFFPDDMWYNLYNGEYVFLDYENSAYLDMPWPGLINIHVAQGFIIPIVDNYMAAMSLRDTRNSNISLIIVQGPGVEAIGTVIFDDGSTYGNMANGNYLEVEYQFFSHNSTFDYLTLQQLQSGYTRATGEWPYISTLIFYGCTAAPEAVYKLSGGMVPTFIPANVYWSAEDMICKIWLKNYLMPDEMATLLIDYFI